MSMLDEAAMEQFRGSLRGELIQRSDPGYDEARKVYNAMIDKRPRMIARCADVADVISAVDFARENDMLLAIRGGGHNGAGLAVVDDGKAPVVGVDGLAIEMAAGDRVIAARGRGNPQRKGAEQEREEQE